MRIHDLEQKSEAWKAWRKEGITASMIPVIMGSSPYQKIDALFLNLIGEAPDQEENFAMFKGSSLEPKILEKFNRMVGDIYAPLCVSHNQHEWARASLDGYHAHEFVPSDTAICEIKYNSKVNHAMAIANKIPLHHEQQMLWQLFVTGAKIGFYVSCDGNLDNLALVEIEPDEEKINHIFRQAQWFYNCVITRTPPTEPLADDLIGLLTKYEEKAIQKKVLEEELDEIKDMIKDITPIDKTIAWGRLTGAWRSRVGSVDYAKIPDLIGINLELFRKPNTQYFDLRLK